MYMREGFYRGLSPIIPAESLSFDITQAAQWFMRDNENLSLGDISSLPSIAPPYPSIWMEFRMPSKCRFMDGYITDTPRSWFSVGCVVESTELLPDTSKIFRKRNDLLLRDVLIRSADTTGMSMVGEMGDLDWHNDIVPKWVLRTRVLLCNSETVGQVCVGVHLLDERGKHIVGERLPSGGTLWAITDGTQGAKMMKIKASWFESNHIIGKPDDKGMAWTDAAADFETPFMFCLSLLHCRNVNVIDTPAPPAPILKQRAKKGIPYIQYKTLEVTPLRTVRQGGTRKDGTLEPKALHFVRGHFKDFSDKGLFGKYKGVYWWDSQVRGDTGKGIIDKDYRVSHD